MRLLAKGIRRSLILVVQWRVECGRGQRGHGSCTIWVRIRRGIWWVTAIGKGLIGIGKIWRVAPIRKRAVQLRLWRLPGIVTLWLRVCSTLSIERLREVLRLRLLLDRATR